MLWNRLTKDEGGRQGEKRGGKKADDGIEKESR